MKALTRILIIEDNPDDEALLMRQLKKADLHGHIKAIHDGGKALTYLTEEQDPRNGLAAIFLDLHLPKISGLKLLEAIKSDERTQHIPVIVMTSSNAPEELERCRELGVSCYVQKPLTFSSFAKAFADTFHAQRSTSQPRVMVSSVD
jgi:two-component system, response regulator